ncbi:MAG TPA: hypothetical protein VFC63_08690 [Blastocatellia bacterium]|nr:hypothetical protein [Blastocatellia bacterium]
MPDLITFLACEKVIVDKADDIISIFNLLEKITFVIPSGIAPSDVTDFPLSWSILTLWRNSGGEENKKYRQRIELHSPQGQIIPFSEDDWMFTSGQANHRLVFREDFFPVAPEGVWHLKLFLREIDATWEEKGSYPIELAYLK